MIAGQGDAEGRRTGMDRYTCFRAAVALDGEGQ
jgi:hypothetical protein